MLSFIKNNKKIVSRNYHGLTGGQVIYEKLKEKNVSDVFMYTGCNNAFN